MNKLSVLIADDEPIQRQIMHDYCIQSRFCKNVVQVKDAVAALEALNNAHFDLLLLDINMPLLSGLSLAKSVRGNVNVIFVTAYAEHAVEAFELNVIDYLLKPVSFERFIQALQKVTVTENTSTGEKQQFITVKQGKKVMKVNVDDILYCEAKGNNTHIFLTDSTDISVYMPLTKLMDELPDAAFTRVHRAFLVNNSKVKAVENNQLYIGSATVPVGANYKHNIEGII